MRRAYRSVSNPLAASRRHSGYVHAIFGLRLGSPFPHWRASLGKLYTVTSSVRLRTGTEVWSANLLREVGKSFSSDRKDRLCVLALYIIWRWFKNLLVLDFYAPNLLSQIWPINRVYFAAVARQRLFKNYVSGFFQIPLRTISYLARPCDLCMH